MFYIGSYRLLRTFCGAVKIECPRCHKLTDANVYSVRERFFLFWVIPLLFSSYSEIECAGCNRTYVNASCADDILKLNPSELRLKLETSVSFLTKLLVILAYGLSILPPFGCIAAGIATYRTRKAASGWKWAARFALAVSTIPWVIVAIAVLTDAPLVPGP